MGCCTDFLDMRWLADLIVCSPAVGIFFLALRARLAAPMISTEITLRPPSNCSIPPFMGKKLNVSLDMVGKEPDVSLMMAHDNGEACDSEAEEGEASAEDSADIEDVATDVSEAAVADEEIIEVIIGGVGTSGGQSGGRSSGGTASAACWGPRLLPNEPLESAKVIVEVVMGAVVVVVATVVVAVLTGVVVAAAEMVFLLTPPKLRKSSTENFNAVGK